MIEQELARAIFNNPQEKTFIDKIFAKDDVTSVRELIKKPRLTREQLLELLYLLSANETKLLNYSAWDRYIALKFFVWIREFIKVAELLYDYKDYLLFQENICKECKGYIEKEPILTYAWSTKKIDKCVCEKPRRQFLTDRTKKYLENCERLIEHNAKFLIDLYFNIGRTTLSLGATGFIETLKNKYEISYPQMSNVNTPIENERKGIFGGLFRGK